MPVPSSLVVSPRNPPEGCLSGSRRKFYILWRLLTFQRGRMVQEIRPVDRFRTLLIVLIAVLLSPLAASAQFDTATVLGAVHDSIRRHRSGATVTLKNVATGITATTVTDGEGNYQFLNVRIGSYTVRAELQGFSVAEADNVVVTVNARQRVDLSLKVGNLGETVTVEGAAKLLETDSSDRGQVIGKEQIVNLPLNGRNYADLALLSPGVRKSAISDSRDASFNVNGLRSARQQLHPRRRRQQLLRHEQPGLLEPGRPDVAGRGRGVQGPDQQLQRRVRTHRRRGRQRLAAQRHERLQRHGVGVQPQRRAERGRLLQADRRRQAEAESQPVRLRLRRPDPPQPHLLLRRLRGFPADLEDADVRQLPTLEQRQGILGKPVEPAHGRDLRQRRRFPRARSPRSRARCSPDSRTDAARGSPTTSIRCRARQTRTTSSISR